jgi:hypothetical protein
MNGRYDGRHRMWRRGRLLFAVLVATAIGVVAYNFGVEQGLSRAAAAPAVAYPWHPWGFGFFPVLFFVLFWFFALRLLFWGVLGARAWRYGRGCGPGYGHGYGHGYGGGLPPMFDEWHRRAHERDREDRTVTSV